MAKFEFKLPDIGEGVTEGEIVSWLVKVGDSVKEDQDMVEVMTDKATVTIGAPKAGKVVELKGDEGDVVPVGDVLVVLDVGGGANGGSAKRSDDKRDAKASDSKGQGADRDSEDDDERAKKDDDERAKEDKRAKKRDDEREDDDERAKEDKRAKKRDDEREEDDERAKKGDDGPAASAVGDIRESLPGMQAMRAPKAPVITDAPAESDYFNEKPLAAPATRKLARELGVDLRTVRPSGAAGRVTREDVERFASAGTRPAAARSAVHDAVTLRPEASARPAPKASPPLKSDDGDQRLPIRGMRKRIYENMARSKHTAAHFTYVDECDTSALRALRERTKPIAEREGVKLSFLPFIIKAVVAALKRHPTLNCLVDDDAGEMLLKSSYDIGIAAATEAGLTVPVLRDADRRSILEIAKEVERLGNEARDGKLKMEDLGGSSFTITSLGKLGGLFATPIVNYPEVAILGVHEMKKRPVVRDDQIVVGEVMLLSLSFDHRLIDGHVGAAFARTIIELLEEPDRLLVSMS